MAAKGTLLVLASLISMGMAGTSQAAHTLSGLAAKAHHMHEDIEALEVEIKHNLRGPYFASLITSAEAMCDATVALERGLLQGVDPCVLSRQAETIERLAHDSITLARHAALGSRRHFHGHHGHYGHRPACATVALKLLDHIEEIAHCLHSELDQYAAPPVIQPGYGQPGVYGQQIRTYRSGNRVGVQVRTGGFSFRFGR